MKKKNNHGPFVMDERNKLIAYKIIAIMYFLTILAILGIILYRQFGLRQEISEFEDIAIVLTVNELFLISALLYFGVIPIQKIRIRNLLIIYAVIVVLGSLFTYYKYNIFESPGLSFDQLINKLLIIIVITGLIILFFVIFSILGKHRMEKELGEE